MTDIIYLKSNLNIEASFTEEDDYLQTLMDAAVSSVKTYLNVTDEEFAAIKENIKVKHSIILLASHLYANRTPVSFAAASKVPLSFEFLLMEFKNLV